MRYGRVAWNAPIGFGRIMTDLVKERPELGLFLPPARARVAAFLIDAAFFATLFFSSAFVTSFATGATSSVSSFLLLAVTVILVNAGFQAVVAWVSGGGSVGKAAAGLCVRRRDGSPIAQTPSEFLRLVARFSIGYALFSIFLLATPWCFVDRLRRCPHDLVLATQVAQVGNSEGLSFRQRLRALHEDIEAGLAIVREQWGWAYRLIRWSSWLVVTVTTFFSVALTKFGLLAPTAAVSSSTPLPAVSSGAWTLSLPVAIGTTTVSATLVISGLRSPPQPNPRVCCGTCPSTRTRRAAPRGGSTHPRSSFVATLPSVKPPVETGLWTRATVGG